ncbi:MAG: alkaline phosphatase family protein [Gammaproteobacteria bacterium]
MSITGGSRRAASPIGGALLLAALLLSAQAVAAGERYAAKSLNFVQHIVVLLVDAGSLERLLPAAPPKADKAGPGRDANRGHLAPDMPYARAARFYAATTAGPAAERAWLACACAPDGASSSRVETLGDQLSKRSVRWAWYVDGWAAATNGEADGFDLARQPYAAFARYAPRGEARATHLKDGDEFLAAVNSAALEEVVFYEPGPPAARQPGESEPHARDAELRTLLETLRASRHWPSLVVVLAALAPDGPAQLPPARLRDARGPGARLPLALVSPFARDGLRDTSFNDMGAIAKLIARRHRLPSLAGQRATSGDLSSLLSIEGLTPPAAPAARAPRKRAGAGGSAEQHLDPRRKPDTKPKSTLHIFDDN